MHESSVHHGTNKIWVLTRSKPQVELDAPISELKVKIFGRLEEWEVQAPALTKWLDSSNNVEVISVIHTNEASTDSNY